MPSPHLIYAEQHCRKTTELGRLSHYIYERTGLPCRMIHADNGGVEHIQEFIDAGFIDYMRIAGEENPLPLLQSLQRGSWHRYPTGDGKSKLLLPGQSIELPRRSGGTLKLVNDLKQVGGYMVEGITSIAELLFMDLLRKARQLGEKPSFIFTEDSFDPGKTEEVFGGGNRQYYNHVQYMVKQMLIALGSLPVPYVFVTGHEGKGKDDNGNDIIGPAIVGQAYTSKIGKDVGHMIHIQREMVQDPAAKEGEPLPPPREAMRAYFRAHPDPENGKMWPAVARVSAFNAFGEVDKELSRSNLGQVFKRWPGGFVELTQKEGVADFIQLTDELKAQKTDFWRRRREEMDRERKERVERTAATAAIAATAPAVAATPAPKEKPDAA